MEDLTEAVQQEYREAVAADNKVTAAHLVGCELPLTEGGEHEGPCRDRKSRVLPEYMSDRDLLLELILTFRQLGDTLEEVGQNPMLRAIPGLGGLFGGKS